MEEEPSSHDEGHYYYYERQEEEVCRIRASYRLRSSLIMVSR